MKRITVLIITAILLLCACEEPLEEQLPTTTTTVSPVTGTITTTSGVTTASTEETTLPAEDISVDLPDNMTFIETGYFGQYEVLGNYLCCVTYKNPNAAYDERTAVMKFYDLDKGTLASSVTMPDKTNVYAIYKGDGDVLCRLVLEKTVEDKGGRYFEHSAAVIFTDFTCEIKEELTTLEASVKQGGHYIAHSGKDLIHAKGGNVLVEGYRADDDLYGFESLTPSYVFPMDDNRFVYRMVGYECIPGFGFYDFETNTDIFVTGSENSEPIGYYNGKIYSVKKVWDGFPTGVYATDTETLETTAIIDESSVSSGREYTDFFIQPDGEYILIFKEWYENDDDYDNRRNAFYKADINSGEIIGELEFSAELLPYKGCMEFIDSSRFLMASDYGERGFIIVNLK